MLLAVDVGNTTILIGLFDGEGLVNNWRLATDKDRTPDELGIGILNLINGAKIEPERIDDAIISSVVPHLNSKLVMGIEKHFEITPHFLDFRSVPLRLEVDEPATVGADRLANSVAGYQIYGGPILIIDFGTAITFDLVSADGEFLGGAIAPEMELTAEMLFEKAALLPEVELALPKSVIGKSTEENIKAGFVLGFVDMISGLIRRFKDEYTHNLRVIATGGKGSLFHRQIELIEEYDPFLTLKGLLIAWQLKGTKSTKPAKLPL